MALSNSVTRILEVKNQMGIHARPAAMIVNIVSKYTDTDVTMGREKDQTVNAKSIMSIMMLAASIGTQLTVTAKGPNAKKVIQELSELFDRKFEEV